MAGPELQNLLFPLGKDNLLPGEKVPVCMIWRWENEFFWLALTYCLGQSITLSFSLIPIDEGEIAS